MADSNLPWTAACLSGANFNTLSRESSTWLGKNTRSSILYLPMLTVAHQSTYGSFLEGVDLVHIFCVYNAHIDTDTVHTHECTCTCRYNNWHCSITLLLVWGLKLAMKIKVKLNTTSHFYPLPLETKSVSKAILKGLTAISNRSSLVSDVFHISRAKDCNIEICQNVRLSTTN